MPTSSTALHLPARPTPPRPISAAASRRPSAKHLTSTSCDAGSSARRIFFAAPASQSPRSASRSGFEVSVPSAPPFASSSASPRASTRVDGGRWARRRSQPASCSCTRARIEQFWRSRTLRTELTSLRQRQRRDEHDPPPVTYDDLGARPGRGAGLLHQQTRLRGEPGRDDGRLSLADREPAQPEHELILLVPGPP